MTLGLYISKRFFLTVIGVILSCALLIFLIDFIELLRRSASYEGVGIATLFYLATIKIPSFIEQLFPFVFLVGGIASYLALSYKSELIVVRAVGVSVWQFLVPALVVTFVFGLATITIFNPVSAYLKEQHTILLIELLGGGGGNQIGFTNSSTGTWLRQEGVDGQTVLRASATSNQGETLSQVTLYVFDHSGAFTERLEAVSAILKQGHWELSDTWVMAPGSPPVFYESYLISTYLSKTQVQESFSDPETISFWELPSFITTTERAGLKATRYRMQYQILLARPFVLCAMVFIAATVSLGHSRQGGIMRLIIVGIGAGIVLFVFSNLLRNMGSAGVLNPILAAWSPGMIGMLAAVAILLYQEDG